MQTVIHQSVSDIDPAQWNGLVNAYADGLPFLKHEFLLALESSGCVRPQTGWKPSICCIYDGKTLVGASPVYEKTHSYGEYVFDWQWANAYHHHGLDYYPKAVSAVPFTPVTGTKFIVDSQHPLASEIGQKLIDGLISHGRKKRLSSLHSLFISEDDRKLLDKVQNKDLQCLIRTDIQYHWQNQQYQNFDDYLNSLQSKKRKNIRRERQEVVNQGIRVEMVEGEDLTQADWSLFHRCYQTTIALHYSRAYLNKAFFDNISESMAKDIVMARATVCLETPDDITGASTTSADAAFPAHKPFAYALFFKGRNGLYGRYWGSLYEARQLHFELCYYQAIDYCIKHQYRRFEAGAQGQHKLSRGLLAQKTYSAHWIFHPQFADAIARYLQEESREINYYEKVLNTHSPFKKSG